MSKTHQQLCSIDIFKINASVLLVENPFAATEKTEHGILSLLQEHWQIFLLRTFKMVLLDDLTAGNQINCAVLEEKTKGWSMIFIKVELVKLKVKSYRHIPAKNSNKHIRQQKKY